MSRPLRIQFPDAWYHVMNRGRREELIFKDKGDYYAFVGLLKDCTEMWNIRVVAYCLMGTHYHMLTSIRKFPETEGLKVPRLGIRTYFRGAAVF